MKPQRTTGNDLFMQLQKERDKTEYMSQWVANASHRIMALEDRLDQFKCWSWPVGALLLVVGVMVGRFVL